MKIGLLTFHNASNYGAVLQAYALQRAINTFTEHNCEVIDYINPAISSRVSLGKMKRINSVKSLARLFIAYPYYAKKTKMFEKFVSENLNLSRQFYTSDTLIKANEIYDTFVSGSDQVLNVNLTHNDYNYYLGFVLSEKLKCGYAVSQGSYDISNNPESIGYLKEFNLLSFRELSTIKALPEECRKKAVHVMDPTFLLTKRDWLSLEEPINVPDKYILLYLISPKPHNFLYVRQLAKQTNLPIYYINYNYILQPCVHNLRYVTPGQFLFLIQNASYVVTNSFHGTALSIIYNKKFATELSREKKNANARITELLSSLNLQGRLELQTVHEIEKDIDYKTVHKQIDNLREKSINFLRQI